MRSLKIKSWRARVERDDLGSLILFVARHQGLSLIHIKDPRGRRPEIVYVEIELVCRGALGR
jgi:hypothetical protein